MGTIPAFPLDFLGVFREEKQYTFHLTASERYPSEDSLRRPIRSVNITQCPFLRGKDSARNLGAVLSSFPAAISYKWGRSVSEIAEALHGFFSYFWN